MVTWHQSSIGSLMTRTWSMRLAHLYCVCVDKDEYTAHCPGCSDVNSHQYFDWLTENEIQHFKWCYYNESMKFGFDSEENMVKFALRWA